MPGFRRQQLHKRPPPAPYHDTTSTGLDNEDDASFVAATTHNECNSGSKSASPKNTCRGSGSHSTSAKRLHHGNHRLLLAHVWSASCGCSRCPGGGGGGGSSRRRRPKLAAALGISACVAVSLLILLLSRPFLGDDRRSRSRENSWNFIVGSEEEERQQLGDAVRGESEDEERSGGGVREEKTSSTSRGRRWGEGVVQGDGNGNGGDGGGGDERVGSHGEGVPSLLERDGGEEAVESRGGVVAAVATDVAEEHPQEAKPLSGTAKRCDDYQKDYGIVPEDSWGSAPKNVQDEWKRLNCDRVLAMNGFSFDDPPTRGRDRAVVVVWSNIRGWLDYLRPSFATEARETCPTECVFTSDRSLLPQADGVLFHGPTFQKKDGFPRAKPPGADYVFVNLEPSTYRPVQVLLRDPRFMSKFDLTMTYERSSDVPLGYVGSWPSSRYFRAHKPSFKEKDGFGSPDAAAAFVSNCKAAGARERVNYMKELMKHATVHSFGYCLHNREEPALVPGDGAIHRQENKVEVLGRYKFLLAFENNNQLQDYVTEKVYNGLQSGTLPVYWGAENVEDFVPRGSVVKASDFSSPAELGKHLKMLAANEEAYEAYFKWRDDPEEEKRFQQNVLSRSAYGVNAMCRLCDRVLAKKKGALQWQ